MKILTTEEDFEHLDEPEFVLFIHTEWSPPSLALKESGELEDCDIPVYLLDADKHPERTLKYSPRATPTLYWIVDGEIKKWQAGYLEGETLEHLFELGEPANDDSS